MKIAGASSIPLIKSDQLPQKVISTLLEMVRPLDHKNALVHSKSLGDITLSIKEPLEASTLYHATIVKEKATFTLNEAVKLPIELKKILSLKPLMTIEHLLSQLSLGKSPQKVLTETLSNMILLTQDKEELKELFSQLIQLLETQESVIPLRYDDENGYVNFKKVSYHKEHYKLPFEAYFQTLGIITGYVSFFKQKKEAHLKVLTQQSKEQLLRHADLLPMELFITIDKKINIKPTTTLLDIQA